VSIIAVSISAVSITAVPIITQNSRPASRAASASAAIRPW
jgi:hypothetical protein